MLHAYALVVKIIFVKNVENQKNITHKKEIIDPFIPMDLKCPDHPEHPVYLFCAEEKGKIILINIYFRNMLHLLLF